MENIVKIDKKYLEEINLLNNTNYFGDWMNNISILKKNFSEAIPFDHIVIDNFLNEKYANELYEIFPNDFSDWYKYENPIEFKYTYDKINNVDERIKNFFYYLSSEMMVDIFRKITNIPDLTYDEYLHGAGLHCHPKNGRLNVHLDYEKHPITGKERRLNIIYFLNKDWENEWNGQNELWNENASKCITKTDVTFNRAIIFRTNDISWHGLSEKITCPENCYRKTLAFYYVSPLSSNKKEEDYRKKAKYTITDENDKKNVGLKMLCEIRENRRLTCEDIQVYYSDWKNDN
jgi:Rps23 Pro-64 3,4-dihydroxylase Tpa1-like proline 4-hydroxylase